MTLQNRHAGDVAIIDVAGRLTHSSGIALRKTLADLVGRGHTRIVLNLDAVDYVDSAGLGELVDGFTSIRARGGALKLLHLNDRVRRPLAVTGMLTFLEAFESEADAVASFDAADSLEHTSCTLVSPPPTHVVTTPHD